MNEDPPEVINCRCVTDIPDDGRLECFGGPWDGTRIPVPLGAWRLPVARVSVGVFARALRNEFLAAVALSPTDPPVIVGHYVRKSDVGGHNRPIETLRWEPIE